MELSILEQLCFSTVRIETENSSGRLFSGTGFFFNISLGEKTVPVIVTNKHVVIGMTAASIIMTEADSNGNPLYHNHFPIRFDNGFEQLWVMHPDPNVDICIMPCNMLIQTANQVFHKKLFYRFFDNNLIPTEEQSEDIDVVEDILMIGYPNGLWDHINNMPIIRKGITATKYSLDYNGKREFVIDAACFPGSSGSPIILFNKGGYTDKKGNLKWGQGRLILLGVLYAGPQLSVDGTIRVITTPDSHSIGIKSLIPNNLGYVLKSKCILDFIPIIKHKYNL